MRKTPFYRGSVGMFGMCWCALLLCVAPAAPGQVLFSESFNQGCPASPGCPGQPAVDLGPGTWDYCQGNLRAAPRADEVQHARFCGVTSADADIWITIGELVSGGGEQPAGAGVWFRAGEEGPSGDSGYRLMVTTTGSLELWWYNPFDARWELRLAPHLSGLEGDTNTTFLLRVATMGGGLEVWINGGLKMTVPITDWEDDGAMGLFTVNAGATFDDVQVRVSTRPQTLFYIQNEEVRAGFFLPWGGCGVDYRVDRNRNGRFDDEPNLIDIYDNGRLLIITVWNAHLPEHQGIPDRGLPYGLTQGGYGHPLYIGAGVEWHTYETDRQLVYATRPMRFDGPVPEAADLLLEATAELAEDGVVHLTYTFIKTNDDLFGWREQEAMSMYAWDTMDRGHAYLGAHPWTADAMHQYGPGAFATGGRVSERYYMFMGEDGFGFGMGAVPLLPHPMRYVPPVRLDSPIPWGRFHYSSLTPYFALERDKPVTRHAFMYHGTFDEVRAKMYELAPHRQWRFDLGHEGWRTLDGVGPDHRADEGTIGVALDAPRVTLQSNDNLHAAAASHGRFRVDWSRPATVQSARLWWRRADTPDFDLSRSIDIPATPPDLMQSVVVQAGEHPEWRGMIQQLRLELDVQNPIETLVIDRMALVWDRSWNFEQDNFPEGWFPHTSHQQRPLQVRDGALRLAAFGPDQAIDSEYGLGVSAQDASIVEVRARTRYGSRMMLHFVHDSFETPSAGKSVAGWITPGDWQTVRFDMSSHPEWQGDILLIRLAYSDAPYDQVDIDYIRLIAADAAPRDTTPPSAGAWPPPMEQRIGTAAANVDVSHVRLTNLADGDARRPSISSDGRWIAFWSDGNVLKEPTPPGEAVYITKVESATFARITPDLGGGWVTAPSISGNGRYVFASADRDLTADAEPLPHVELFRYDRTMNRWDRISHSQQPQPWPARPAAVSEDGRLALRIERDGDGQRLALYEDGAARTLFHTTHPYGFGAPTLSADGGTVAFSAGQLPQDDGPAWVGTLAYRHDLRTGELIRQGDRHQLDNPLGTTDHALAADGTLWAFAADRWLVPQEEFRNWDRGNPEFMPFELFYHDRASGTLRQRLDTFSARFSARPALSADGHRVVFVSSEDHLRGANPDFLPQLFMHDGDTLLQLTAASDSETLRWAVPAVSASANAVVFHAPDPNTGRDQIHLLRLPIPAATLILGGGE